MAVLGRPFFCGHIPDEHFIKLNIIVTFLFGKHCSILLTGSIMRSYGTPINIQHIG
jgi:hypothetical protein